ncbi:TraR/DksA C4-type zinc finger protein [Alicyclobacillus sp.]|uniref:TraR/DksA C4-type zinc finger protein n=1 Tax=Alicyclobacillus sp. TaxID=61169 RepID=UPI0025C3FD7B|nr:TraR/DksA C4-type zinc finger protein [Alicyclobacillus sp.]MCL6515398.1 TraR/DksA C4-type zinc finger protein [Alicyclobacillus sp.]
MARWEAQRQRLARERQEVMKRLERSGEYGLDDPMNDELGELSGYDNHPADIGSELFERGKDLALRDLDHVRLQEIDRALQAMENGTYGTCARCGRSIPTERLEANPLATLCLDCKREDERQHPMRERPIEEVFLYPGFGRTFTDDTSNVVFDGEDAWEAVARYNQRPGYGRDYEGYGNVSLDDNEGVVEQTDRISNEEYESQLP